MSTWHFRVAQLFFSIPHYLPHMLQMLTPFSKALNIILYQTSTQVLLNEGCIVYLKKKYWKSVYNRCASLIYTLLIKIQHSWDLIRSTDISQDLLRSHKIYRDLTRSTEISQDLLRSQKIYWDLKRSTDLIFNVWHLTFDIDMPLPWHLTFDIDMTFDIWHLTFDMGVGGILDRGYSGHQGAIHGQMYFFIEIFMNLE